MVCQHISRIRENFIWDKYSSSQQTGNCTDKVNKKQKKKPSGRLLHEQPPAISILQVFQFLDQLVKAVDLEGRFALLQRLDDVGLLYKGGHGAAEAG
jgi:hypothetical protein